MSMFAFSERHIDKKKIFLKLQYILWTKNETARNVTQK